MQLLGCLMTQHEHNRAEGGPDPVWLWKVSLTWWGRSRPVGLAQITLDDVPHLHALYQTL